MKQRAARSLGVVAVAVLLAFLAAGSVAEASGSVVASGLLPVHSAVATAALDGEPTPFAADSRKGTRTIAFAQGIVRAPAEIAVRARAVPAQRVTVGWTAVCLDGTRLRLGTSSFSVVGTQMKRLDVPTAAAGQCSVAVAARLAGFGSLKVELLAAQRAARQPSELIDGDVCAPDGPVTLPSRNPSHGELVAWWRSTVQAQVRRYQQAGVPLPAKYRYPGDSRARTAYNALPVLVPKLESTSLPKDRRMLADVSRMAAVLNATGFPWPECAATGTQVEVSLRLFAHLDKRSTVTATGPGVSAMSTEGQFWEFTLPVGTAITLTAIPAPGVIFAGWNGARCGWPYEDTKVPGVHKGHQNPWTCTITPDNPPIPGQQHGPFVIVADADFCDPDNTPPGLCESLPSGARASSPPTGLGQP